MTDKNIPEPEPAENTVEQPDGEPRDHKLNLSVTEEDWHAIEQHGDRMKDQLPNRRVIPMAMAAYDIFRLGLKTLGLPVA